MSGSEHNGIDLDHDPAEKLKEIPQIGDKRAKKIMECRAKGPLRVPTLCEALGVDSTFFTELLQTKVIKPIPLYSEKDDIRFGYKK